MAMLSIVLALASPSLAHFFRGRGLDSEAKRFLALTRYAQSRAVSEGVPMRLWIDEEQRAYGLEAERSYVEEDTKAVEFGLGSNLVVEVELPLVNQLSTRFGPRQATAQATDNRPSVRFTPDGFISETSPDRILFRQIREGEDDAVLIGQSQLRLNYEILTNQPPLLRR
jgi:Tfp pilus assembly protein FimT